MLVATPEFLNKRFRLDVRVQQKVLSIDRESKTVTVLRQDSGQEYEQSYDKLILAPGATPFVPPMDGADADNVLTLRNMADMDRIKAHVDRKTTGRAIIGKGTLIFWCA